MVVEMEAITDKKKIKQFLEKEKQNNTCKMSGYSLKKPTEVKMYHCPKCGKSQGTSMSLNQDRSAECWHCKHREHYKKFKLVSVKKNAVVCANCNNEVLLLPENILLSPFPAYMCEKCHNIVGIKYRNNIIQPEDVYNVKWSGLINKSLQVQDMINFTICKTKKDFLVLRALQFLAKKEDGAFLSGSDKHNQYGIFFDNNNILGYIMWAKSENCINQLFVMKEHRHKGYGTIFVRYWVEKIIDTYDFIIESPNSITQQILIKLEYAKREKETIQGIRCTFRQ